jgi:outer membrane protein
LIFSAYLSANKTVQYSKHILAFLPVLAFAYVNPAEAETGRAEANTGVAQPLASAPADAICAGGICRIKMTPDQVLSRVEALIAARDFTGAMPLIEVLGQAPELQMQQKFLKGFVAAETGDLKTAETVFRAILRDHPSQTRVRLELARIMMLNGKEGAADYHFRLAEQDGDLPPEIAQTIRSVRGVLRNQRAWHFNLNLGLAPDTNINSATSAESVNVNFGPIQIPLPLDENARQKSGIGQTGGFSAGLRFRVSEKIAVLVDTENRIVNYKDSFADDIQTQLAIGPEIRLGQTSSFSVQALGEQRWYGGQKANRDFGLQIGFQKVLDKGQRVGLAIDARKSKSQLADAYSGTMLGGNLTYERVIGRAFIASASIFGRADNLESKTYSNKTFGASLGIGGELPYGINAGLNASISRALFDAPQYLYSSEARNDLRFLSRAYLGVRSLKLVGFSPSVDYTFYKVNSNYTLYQSDRHRVNFKFSRYF